MPAIIPDGTEIVVDGIVLKVRIDPFEGGIDERGRPWRTVAYLCAGDDVNAACDKLKGIGVAGGFPRPHRYPKNENLVCQTVSFKLKGPRSTGPNLVKAPYAEISASYGVPEWDIYGDAPQVAFDPDNATPWTTYRVQGGLEVIPWPSNNSTASGADLDYEFDVATGEPGDGIRPELQTLSYRMPVEDWIVRRSMIENFRQFKAVHESVVGKVNGDPLWGYPAGVFLMEPLDYEPCYDPSGKRLGEFTLVLRKRKFPWNAEPIPGEFGVFADVVDPILGTKKYASGNFTALLQFGL